MSKAQGKTGSPAGWTSIAGLAHGGRRSRRALPSRLQLLAAGAAFLAFASASSDLKAQDPSLPGNVSAVSLVHLRDVDASILQDIRYAGFDNFTGRPVPGYAAAECLLLPDVAEALSRVQTALRKQRLSLKVYDCYRPRRAVRAFRAWMRDPLEDPLLKRFHPSLYKGQLMTLGYIAAVSRHSRGDTVDLTLVAQPAKRVRPFRRRIAYGDCTGAAAARAPDNSVDMGTGFDCFDPLSHTHAAGLAPQQQGWRRILTDAMVQQGFQNYRKEWWHFTYLPERHGPSFDVPVTGRPH